MTLYEILSSWRLLKEFIRLMDMIIGYCLSFYLPFWNKILVPVLFQVTSLNVFSNKSVMLSGIFWVFWEFFALRGKCPHWSFSGPYFPAFELILRISPYLVWMRENLILSTQCCFKMVFKIFGKTFKGLLSTFFFSILKTNATFRPPIIQIKQHSKHGNQSWKHLKIIGKASGFLMFISHNFLT